jgi:hypothetical protein
MERSILLCGLRRLRAWTRAQRQEQEMVAKEESREETR